MYTNSILAVSGALLSAVAAVPMAGQHHHHHHVRDYVVVPHIEVVYETVAVTKTVWVDAGESTPEVKPEVKPQGYAPPAEKPSSTPAATTPAAYAPPAPPAPPAYTPEAPPSSSVYVPPPAPTTPTSNYVAPPPTTYEAPPPKYEAPPPIYEAPAPYVAPPAEAAPPPAPVATPPSVKTSGSNLSGLAAGGKTYTGDLTWYDVGLGACGLTNTKDEAVVAISEAIFDSYGTGNPNLNPLCGGTVTITGKDGQKYTAKIVDRCPGCTLNDLDLSQDFFNKVTNNGDGRVGEMEWCFD